jgi:segregation and condensation protein A
LNESDLPTEPEAIEPASAAADEVSEDSAESDPHRYTVQLDRFEGPLDLLLYLIQRDEVDIYDIPIAHITKQYLSYMELLDVFDLDNAGEFLVMAATLMRIKARLLLPVQRPGDEEEDDVDPRDELVRRLLEYKKYKEASEEFGHKETERGQFFSRGTEFTFEDQQEEPAELSLSLFDLLRAVRNVLDQLQGENAHHVYTEVYTVEGQEELILERLGMDQRIRFEEIFRGMKIKMEVVVTFVALLDLLKSQRIIVHQSKSYGELWLSGREPDPTHADELSDEARDAMNQESTDESAEEDASEA